MATYTTKLHLGKPDMTDMVSPKIYNDNFDILDNKVGELATVATSGSYNDLSNKPTLGTQVTYSLSGTTLTITTK